MDLLQKIYVGMVILAALSSLVSFGLDLSYHLKFFSCLLGLTFLVELSAAVMVDRYINNWWLYNLFILIEFPAYSWYYLQIVRQKVLRKILWFFLVIFPIFWLVMIYTSGLKNWIGPIVTIGSFFSALFALMYYHRIATAREILSLRTLSEFWIATGMLIFYLGSFAFFGMLNYILKDETTAARLT